MLPTPTKGQGNCSANMARVCIFMKMHIDMHLHLSIATHHLPRAHTEAQPRSLTILSVSLCGGVSFFSLR